MENIYSDKRIIKAALWLLIILSVYFGLKTLNTLKENRFIGAGVTPGTTIAVSGTGEINAVPDIATFTASISEDGTTPQEAQNKVTAKEKKVLDFARGLGIADKDIKATSSNVAAKYDYTPCAIYPCPQRQNISGYTGTESIDIKVRNTDLSGKVQQGLAGVGVELSGPNYTIDNEDTLKAQAREKAIKDAKGKADALEHDLGINLGRIVNFSEDNGGFPVYYAKGAMTADSAGAPAPELPKGENTITSNVTITYEIR